MIRSHLMKPTVFLAAALLWACGAQPPPPTPTPTVVTQPQPGLQGMPADGFLDQYAATYRFRLGKPGGIAVSASGDEVLFLRSGPRSFERVLYRFDPKTGQTTEALTGKGLLDGADETMTVEEKARRERLRLAARGIARFALVEPAGTLLIPLSGRSFVYDPKSKSTFGTREGGVQDARLSPDGSKLAVVRKGDVFVVSTTDGAARQLTQVASKTITAGLPEFVAQEEMDRLDGMWWGPRSERVLWQHTDTAGMEQFHIIDPMDPSKIHGSPYPRPGGKNAVVRLFVSAIDGKTGPVEVRWDRAAFPYVVRAVWPKKGPLTLVVMNRRQSQVAVLSVAPKSGETKLLLTEQDAAWVNTDSQMPKWLPDGSGFLWTTERSGFWQLELRGPDGALTRSITPKSFGYNGLAKLDAKAGLAWVYGGSDPTQQHLFVVPLAGGAPKALTTAPGWHTLYTGAKTRRVVHMHAPLAGPRTYAVRLLSDDGLGTVEGLLESKAESPGFEPKPEFRTVQLEGRTHHAVVIRPRAFDAKRRYPVILSVYGGPHYAAVRQVGQRLFFDQWLADQGFIVIKADGRGTPRRGRDWERAIREDFITKPMADQVGVLQALGAQLPELDMAHVGIYGWSFGGYFSAMAVMQRPDVFAAGIAGAPVTDWRDYDTTYTERYLGLPDSEQAAYDVSSVLTYAKDLQRPLMLIHGTGDDNVYFVHALKMSDALFRANKPHDFIVLAGHSHMVADVEVVRSQYTRFVGFFRKHLGASSVR
jgi:dipeptidyl-peptidase-4